MDGFTAPVLEWMHVRTHTHTHKDRDLDLISQQSLIGVLLTTHYKDPKHDPLWAVEGMILSDLTGRQSGVSFI